LFDEFHVLFEPGPATVPGYLVLLNLRDHAPAVIDQLRQAIDACGDRLGELIEQMLASPNWRPQLLGASALRISRGAQNIEALWSALDRPCWTSPQLAAVASRIDPDFLPHARARLEQGCPMNVSNAMGMSPLERHSALGPGSLTAHSAKSASALAALCAADGKADSGLDALLSGPKLRSLVDQDIDQSGSIALSWREKMDSLIAESS